MIKLKAPVNTGNRYCGPAVISALTGIGTADAATIIRSVTRQKYVKGTSTYGCLQTLRLLGVSSERVPLPAKRPTLAGWLKATKAIRTAGRVFLLVAGNHWQIVSGRRYTCGIVRDVVSVRDARVKRRARVTEVYEVDNNLLPTLAPSVLGAKKERAKRTNAHASARSKAGALAKTIGVELEKHWNHEEGREPEVWVYPPDGISDENGNDPFDDHLAFGWPEVLRRVQVYAKAAAELKTCDTLEETK